MVDFLSLQISFFSLLFQNIHIMTDTNFLLTLVKCWFLRKIPWSGSILVN